MTSVRAFFDEWMRLSQAVAFHGLIAVVGWRSSGVLGPWCPPLILRSVVVE
jgi:hypothetical protein